MTELERYRLPALAHVPGQMTAEEWAEFAASSADGRAALAEAARAYKHAREGRHAPRTVESYDYWWGRFCRWLDDPSERVRGRALPAAPLSTFTSGTPASQQMLLLWLFELVHGPEDPDDQQAWVDDFGWLSPNTLDKAVAGVKARFFDATGSAFVPTTETKTVLKGLRRHLRDHYGRDRQATALLGEHIRTMITFLTAAQDPIIVRDRLIVELVAVGLSAAEIGNLGIDDVRVPTGGLAATTVAANEQLFELTGDVGMRTLVVPGRVWKQSQSPPRLVPLTAGSPVAAALDVYLQFRDPTSTWLIDGLSTTNRRSQIRDTLVALARGAGFTWKADTLEPDQLVAMRNRAMHLATVDDARRCRDVAMIWIGWLCALRREELCALNVEDVGRFHDRYVIHIRRSKTDQQARGAKLPVLAASDAVAAELNPVAAIGRWLDCLDRIYDGNVRPDTPLFPALTRAGTIYIRGGIERDRLNAQGFSDRLRLIASWCGIFDGADDLLNGVSGHSLRRGFVTSAAIAGKNALQIRRTTRHADLNSLARYVEEVQDAYTGTGIGIDDLIMQTVA